jgi:phospholipase A1
MIICRTTLSVTAAMVLFASLFSVSAFAQSMDQSCFLEVLADADDSTTVGELRALCRDRPSDEAPAPAAKPVPVYEQSALEERLAYEETGKDRPFVITAHQPSYILWSSVDEINVDPFLALEPTAQLDDSEMMFQLSIKAPIWQNMFGSDIDGYFGYTTKSYWQLFNDDFSAPFRETNYQPELFVRKVRNLDSSFGIAGWDLSLNHESNGRAEPLSRSWNRVMGRAGLQLNPKLTLFARAWWRIPEDEEDDNNPNMYHYYGYGDVRAVWTPNRNTFTALLRPGTEEFSYELTWSFPISRVFRVYALYYNGYGESMIDYNYKNERIAIGIALNDFLSRN